MSAPSRHDHSTPDGEAERVDLPITGMTCAACAGRIERSLNKVKGVRKASVNLATSRARIEYDPSATGIKELAATVKDVGYGTAGTVTAQFIIDDSARPSGSALPLEKHLSALRGVPTRASTSPSCGYRSSICPRSPTPP